MYSKINYTIVGIFVTIFTAALFAFGFWLAKYDQGNSYKLYKIYFNENVSGLSVDSAVKLKGVDIGKVVKISIDPKNINQVEVLVKIKKDVPIKEDMTAHLEPVGITGLLNIVIDGGSNKAKDLVAKNGKIPVIKSKPSWLVSTKNEVSNVTRNLNEALIKTNQLLSEKNIKNISQIIENIKDLTYKGKNLESNITKLIENSNLTLSKIDKKVDEFNIKAINKNFNQISQDFHSITKNTIPMLKSIKKSSNALRVVINKVNKGLNRGDYNLREIFTPLTIDIRLLTNEINSLTREISQSPSDIIFKSREPRKGPGE